MPTKSVKNFNDEPASDRGLFSRWIVPILLVITILSVVALRVRLIDLPLERDEGEYAYMAQRMMDGFPPYVESYSMKAPGIYCAYAAVMALFGESARGIHVGLLLVNLASIFLIYRLARSQFSPFVGCAAAALYAFSSLSPIFLGMSAHATHFVVFSAIIAIIVFLRALYGRSRALFFISGLFFGIAVLMKQHGLFFGAFATFYLIWIRYRDGMLDRKFISELSILLLGCIIPFAIACGILNEVGAFEKFWFWNFTYASTYASRLPDFAANGIGRVIPAAILIASAAAIYGACRLEMKSKRSGIVFATALLIFSFISICPGFHFRPHYFIQFLPAASIFLAVIISKIPVGWVGRFFSSLIVVMIISFLLLFPRVYLFSATPDEASRMTYDSNPFPESMQIASYIEKNSAEGDSIGIIGSEPQICFYANRRCATGYIYTYELLEPHSFARTMQDEMILELEAASPKFIVDVHIPHTGEAKEYSSKRIFEWAAEYEKKFYEQVGLVIVPEYGTAKYYWGADARRTGPYTGDHIEIFRRR